MRAMRKMPDCRILACLILCALFPACNDTDDVHIGLRTSTYRCTDAPLQKANSQAPDPVALTCGSEVANDVFEVFVEILGPTASTNIKGLHFDVVYARDSFAYVDGSATMIPDNFLTWGGGVCDVAIPRTCSAPAEKVGISCTTNAACNIPGVNVPVVTATETVPMPPPLNVQGRLTITIDRVAPADGVRVAVGGERQVLRFQMRATTLTNPIDPTLFKFENAAAVDPTDTPIASIAFRNQLFLWVQ